MDRHLDLPGGGRTRFTGFAAAYTERVRRTELPSGTVTLLLNLGDPLVVVGAAGPTARGSFVAGLLSRPAYTERTGFQSGIHIRLSPLAARAAFGVPMRELSDDLVELDALLGKDYERLRDLVEAARAWPDRLAVVRDALAHRIARATPPTPVVEWGWRQLQKSRGRARIADLVHASGVSHRHFAARFGEEIGTTPKAAARLLRFEHSLGRLRSGEPLAVVAGESGYYDQAHLDREYQALARTTPSRLRSDFSNTQAPAGT